MGENARTRGQRRHRDGVKEFSEVLGLDTREKWLKVKNAADAILQERELVGKIPSLIIDDEKVQAAMADDLEQSKPEVFSLVPEPEARRSIISSIFHYRMTSLRSSLQKREVSKRKSLGPESDSVRVASVADIEEEDEDEKEDENEDSDSDGGGEEAEEEEEEEFFSLEEVVITFLIPSVPSVQVKFIPWKVPDNEISIARLFEVLAEEGLRFEPEDFILRTESGKHLSSSKDLRVAFQVLVKEENPAPNWLILTKDEDAIHPRPRSYFPSDMPPHISGPLERGISSTTEPIAGPFGWEAGKM